MAFLDIFKVELTGKERRDILMKEYVLLSLELADGSRALASRWSGYSPRHIRNLINKYPDIEAKYPKEPKLADESMISMERIGDWVTLTVDDIINKEIKAIKTRGWFKSLSEEEQEEIIARYRKKYR